MRNTSERLMKFNLTKVAEYVGLFSLLVTGWVQLDSLFVSVTELRIETANLRIEMEDIIIERSVGVLARYQLDMTAAERMAIVREDLERALTDKKEQQKLLEQLRAE